MRYCLNENSVRWYLFPIQQSETTTETGTMTKTSTNTGAASSGGASGKSSGGAGAGGGAGASAGGKSLLKNRNLLWLMIPIEMIT